MAEDLEKLKEEITRLGDKIRELKSASEVDKAAIGAAVNELLAAKKEYADSNNGIGVDGKPYEPPMSKADKKKKAKEDKTAAAANAVQEDSTSKNAQKKAAKKAAAKAKKAAAKAGGDASASDGTTSVAKKGPPPTARMSAKVQPDQIVINPNVPLGQQPVASLTVAVMTNTMLDYSIYSDHLSRHSVLGLPEGGAVVGDFAMARYILRRSGNLDMLGGETAAMQGVVDAWVCYAQSLTQLEDDQTIKAIAMTLEHALPTRTYLVGHSMTLADIALFAALGCPSQLADRKAVHSKIPDGANAAKRWIDMMATAPAIMEATQLAIGVSDKEAIFDDDFLLEPLASGMNLLQGGIPGRVVTRFPPEPSGYLHIGHSKAVLLNDYYARRYKGRIIVRFDDTNPSKEKEEFQSSIVEDLAKIGVKPDLVTFTSDYFGTIQKYAEDLIKGGLAYMDDTPQEQMKTERMEKKDSVHRNQSPEGALKYFKLMCDGTEEGGKWCLRAKINMQSLNGTLRDPVLFRQNLTPHHRSGTKFKAYPTYDLACPIVDSLEGVTHALRTTEYNDRDEQYQWLQIAMKLRRVRIHAFSRVNFYYTVMSKRKLAWFVESGFVTGWDDPRFPTLRGVVRRGIHIDALRQFMYSQGASRRVVNMEWNKFWAENKKEIDKEAKRYMAIDKEQHVKLTITNGPEGSDNAFLTTTLHPKNPSIGTRVVRMSKRVLIETLDIEGLKVGDEIVLLRWGCVKILKMGSGEVEGELNPNGDIKSARKLSWIADVSDNTPSILTEFDNLVTKERLEEEDNFEDFINPNTKATTEVIGDPGLKTLRKHEIIQLERRGYYRVDRPYVSAEKPIILFMVPDGKMKSMGGLTGKLAHR